MVLLAYRILWYSISRGETSAASAARMMALCSMLLKALARSKVAAKVAPCCVCDDTLVIPGFVHASLVLPSTNGGLETSLAPWKFSLKGGTLQGRLSSRGSCWSRLVCGSSVVVIRGLVIESRDSFQETQRGWQPLRPVSLRLQFMLGMGKHLRWGGEVMVCLG